MFVGRLARRRRPLSGARPGSGLVSLARDPARPWRSSLEEGGWRRLTHFNGTGGEIERGLALGRQTLVGGVEQGGWLGAIALVQTPILFGIKFRASRKKKFLVSLLRRPCEPTPILSQRE